MACVNGHGEYFKVTAGDYEVNWLLAVNTLAILFYISMTAFSGLVCALWVYGVHFFFMQGINSFFSVTQSFRLHCYEWRCSFSNWYGARPRLDRAIYRSWRFRRQKTGTFRQYSSRYSKKVLPMIIFFSFFRATIRNNGGPLYARLQSGTGKAVWGCSSGENAEKAKLKLNFEIQKSNSVQKDNFWSILLITCDSWFQTFD